MDHEKGYELLSSGIDLVYSPDDGGYYLHKYNPDDTEETSDVYPNEEGARQAFKNDTAKYSKLR